MDSVFFTRHSLGLLLTLLRHNYDVTIWGDAGSGSNSRDRLYDLINGVLCLIVSRMKRRPFIIWFGGWEWKEKDHWDKDTSTVAVKRKVLSMAYLLMLSRAKSVITYGSLHKDFYSSSLGIKPEKIFIAPNSSIIQPGTVSEEETAALRKKLGIEGKKVVLYVGRLDKRKNVDLLIRAFCRMGSERNTCLIIIGGGDQRAYLEGICSELNADDILFLGRIDNEKLAPYYAVCDIFVYPTTREPWGLAINEAMQFGKPVIATTRVAAAHDLIKHGVNGFVVQEGDAGSLAEAMETIIADDELAHNMGQESRRIIEQGFTYEYMAEGFRQAIEHSVSH